MDDHRSSNDNSRAPTSMDDAQSAHNESNDNNAPGTHNAFDGAQNAGNMQPNSINNNARAPACNYSMPMNVCGNGMTLGNTDPNIQLMPNNHTQIMPILNQIMQIVQQIMPILNHIQITQHNVQHMHDNMQHMHDNMQNMFTQNTMTSTQNTFTQNTLTQNAQPEQNGGNVQPDQTLFQRMQRRAREEREEKEKEEREKEEREKEERENEAENERRAAPAGPGALLVAVREKLEAERRRGTPGEELRRKIHNIIRQSRKELQLADAEDSSREDDALRSQLRAEGLLPSSGVGGRPMTRPASSTSSARKSPKKKKKTQK